MSENNENKIDWKSINSFERHDKLDLPVGESAKVVFKDDGSMVSKKRLQDADAKYPRDSYIFVLDVNGKPMEFWIGAQSYSVLNQIKAIRTENGDTLVDAKATIKRVSKGDQSQASYEVKAR
jgi:hypothetical protein